MLDNEKDKFIKETLQKDKIISDKANDIFKNMNYKQTKEVKTHKWVGKLLTVAATFVVVALSANIAIQYNKNIIDSDESIKIANINEKKSMSYGAFVITEENKSDSTQLTITKDGKEIYSIDVSTPENKNEIYYADWNNSNEQCLRVRVDNYIENDDSRYSYTWYKFDKDGNLLEEKEYIENYVYKDENNYGDFKILVTSDKKLIVYKPLNQEGSGPEGIVTVKLDFYVDEEHLNDAEWVKQYGKGYYADWNNANEECLRVRVDKYIENDDSRYSYIWYKLDKNGNLLEEKEYIEKYAYKDEKSYGKFKILVTTDQKLVIYEPLSQDKNSAEGIVAVKLDFYIDEEHLNDAEWVKQYGRGYYADWNNSGEKYLRIRIDKFNNEYQKRDLYIWYTIDENGSLIKTSEHTDNKQTDVSNNEIANNTVENTINSNITNTSENTTKTDKFSNYTFENTWSTAGGEVSEYYEEEIVEETIIKTLEYNNYKIEITSAKNMIINFNNSQVNKKVGVLQLNIPDEEFENIKIGNGFYIDWNNANKQCLRIRIDKYSEDTGKLQGCTWYYFDNNGNQITVAEYEQTKAK